VMQKSCRWLPPFERVAEGGEDETGMQGRATGPTDNATAPAIEDGGEVKPAFGGLEVWARAV
jgi:hypothetical protein